ncbi:putative HTH La-type RNA-binding protein [Cladobotryum mycophilum]|uniref:HTH La-type RNA-binding protein n=1 Tax=Cladobotryum mycophilum TaxID=491253 RepID=A0ABR0S691_9HYPO
MATASAFSYAQAAKGQGSNTPSNPTSQAQDSQPASSTVPKATPPVENSNESIDTVQNSDIPPTNVEKQDVASNNGSETEAQSESVVDAQRDTARDDETGRLDRPWRRNDKGTRSSSTTTRSVDEQDSRRQRKSKKSKASEKTPNEQAGDKDQEPAQELPKVELLEAPIPSVNIWQQRKEAQLAKVKPSTTSTTEQATNGLPNGTAATKPTEDRAASPRDHATNGSKSHRRPADTTRPERSANRGSKLAEKEAKDNKADAPPSVADATAWPTPETAIKEDKKKPAEKVDRPEKDLTDDGAQSKPRQKWVTMEYVPSVSFETQIPMRGNKPRPSTRSANGARTGTAGTNAGEKATPTTTSGSSTQQNKANETRDRPRDGVNGATRTTSSPSTNKRTPDNTHPREQKKPAAQAVADKPKEPAPSSNEQGPTIRERPEGRNERGRGGYRGRGGHHPVNSHHQQHTGPSFVGTGAVPPRAQGPYSPPSRQGGHGQMYVPRGGRGRGSAGSNFHRVPLPNGTARIPPVQTQFGAYDYPLAMSAMPFQPQPYWDNMVMPVLKNQIEYYFSIENLCKDMYLRARMDTQGFVPLHFIAAFKRVRDLSADINLVRAICEMSTEIDFVVGDDDIERIRRREGWEKFVLPIEDRDDFARTHGPARFTFKNRPYQVAPQFNGMAAPYGMAPPPAYPTHTEAFQQMPDESAAGHGVNGYINGYVNGNGHGNGHGVTSQLSADVPDFSPSGSVPLGDQSKGVSINGHVEEASAHGLSNGVHSNAQSS